MKSCILTIIKNEHEYLDEWIKYHIELGINHIFILEDLDSNTHKEITDKYNEVTLMSVIDVFESKEQKDDIIKLKNSKKSVQLKYFIAGLKYIQNHYIEYDWCFTIDNDEFITIENKEKNIEDIINLYKDYDAFILQWENYGANGLISKPSYKEKGLIETYTLLTKGEIKNGLGGIILTKPCFNLRTFVEEYYWNNHQPKDICNWCKTDFSKDRQKEIFDNIYIRHYITKSWEEYIWKKNNRGYFYGLNRTKDLFFILNPDLKKRKYELKDMAECNFEYTNDVSTLVILPYIKEYSQGNEIELALTSWRKYCKFNYHFVVIGEFNTSLIKKYPWVDFIVKKRIEKKQDQYTPHLDIINKFECVMNMYKDTYDGFIYMCDDEYAIRPFDLSDIKTTHYFMSNFDGDKDEPKYSWLHDKWKTKQLLLKENLPHKNYTIHAPYYMEFSKLNEIINKFDLKNESYVFDDIYFNYFEHEEPININKIQVMIWENKYYKNKLEKAINNPNIKFISNAIKGWSKELEIKLNEIITSKETIN